MKNCVDLPLKLRFSECCTLVSNIVSLMTCLMYLRARTTCSSVDSLKLEVTEQHLGQFTERKLCPYHVSFGTLRPVNSSNTLQRTSQKTHVQLLLVTASDLRGKNDKGDVTYRRSRGSWRTTRSQQTSRSL